jgi:Protein of unknown function (DUF3611)
MGNTVSLDLKGGRLVSWWPLPVSQFWDISRNGSQFIDREDQSSNDTLSWHENKCWSLLRTSAACAPRRVREAMDRTQRGHGKRQVHALLIAGLNPLVEYLTFADLLILAFTTVRSYWYTRIARQLADPARRPSQKSLQRAAWIGVAVGAVGIVFSMLVMLFEWPSF